jgi:sigma-B regulation protein RsbU (phosphoserine phosphatase)
MARKDRPATPLTDLAHLLWQVPVYAIPFALFFLLSSGGRFSRDQLLGYWIAAMTFTAAINLCLFFTRHVVDGRLHARFRDDPRATWYMAAAYLVASVAGTMIAAGILNVTLIPGLLAHARGVVMLLVYTLLFGALFLGLALASNFYRQAMERAGSERELLLARRIQRSFLLSEFPERARLEAHAVNVSSKEVSGDFYDVVAPGEDRLLLAIADVSGKGVPAALLSSMLQASLRTQAATVLSPASMMRTINGLACQRAVTGQFATFFLAAIDEPTLTLRYTNAGHNFPVLMRADGTRELLATGGLVVGMMEGLPYEEGVVSLATGDRLVFYTDGVSEAANASGEMFGEDRLYALLDALPRALPAEGIVNRVLEGVRAFLGGTEAGDDITVMALRVLPPTTGDAPR